MKGITVTVCAVGVAVASWLAPGRALADEPATSESRPVALAAQKMSGGATVTEIDPNTRQLTLKMDDGNNVTVQVPATVTRFDQIKKGDHIQVSYFESVALALVAGGQPGSSSRTIVSRQGGQLPGGVAARKVTSSVEITKIEGDKLSVKRPDGTIDTIDVTDQAMKNDLAKLHVGDRIKATYTEATAVSVTRDENKQQQKQD